MGIGAGGLRPAEALFLTANPGGDMLSVGASNTAAITSSREGIMKGLFPLIALSMLLLAASAGAQWSEDFDSYPTGGLIGNGGWEGWEGDPTLDAFVVDSMSVSSPNGVAVVGTTDVVQQFSETEGGWILTAQQYIPSGGFGKSYFILLNTYEAGGHDWSLDLEFDLDGQVVTIVEGSAVKVLQYDQWVEIKVEIDLNNNEQSIYYAGEFMETIPWQTTGVNELQALDLFGNDASTVFYDDIDLSVNTAFDETTWGQIKSSL